MSLTDLIDDLAEKSDALRAAMQSSNAAAIESAMLDMQGAVEAMRQASGWGHDPKIRGKLAELKPQLDESRALACLLADMTGQMHEVIAARVSDVRRPLYARTGDRVG